MKERRETERNMMIKEGAAEDISGGGRGLPRRTVAASQRRTRTKRARERGRDGGKREQKQGVTRRGTRRDEEEED